MKVLKGIFVAVFALAAVSVAGTAMADGADVYKKKCKACHLAAPGGKHTVGPNLHGIVGMKAASVAGYSKYSDGMKGSGLTWDAATLDKYLADPKGVVAGTNMKFAGLKKAEDRAAVIGYLETLK